MRRERGEKGERKGREGGEKEERRRREGAKRRREGGENETNESLHFAGTKRSSHR